MPLQAQVSAISSVSPVGRVSGPVAAAANAGSAGGSGFAAQTAPSGRSQLGKVVESSLVAGPATVAASRDSTPLSGLRDVSREARSMAENPSADTMKKEIASTQSQPAGAVYSVKKIAQQAETEMKDREPTPVEVLKDQQAGGKPGGNVAELNTMIDQASPIAQKTDLAASRTDASKNVSKLRDVSEQALAEGKRSRGIGDKPSASEQMLQQLTAANAHQGAYSNFSLAAVSPQTQRGRTVRLSM